LPGGGEMEELIDSLDWSKTPIGPRETWSPALKTMVRILLANRFPMLLWWGPEYISIYNDAYIPILGKKHPWGLGKPVRECWSEIWDVLKPLIDAPYNGGPATWSEDIELYINRSDFTEETHFTIAYSPVPDETAERGIGGVLATVHEVTAKVLGQRRGAALRELASGVEAKTAEEACVNAAAKLVPHGKDIPFALLYLAGEDGTATLAAAAGVENAAGIAPGSVRLSDESAFWPLQEARASGQMQIVPLPSDLMAIPKGPWPEPPNRAAVLPIRSHLSHQFSGFLVAGLSPKLRLDESYTDFLKLVTSQVATTIATARAYGEERRRADALAEIDRAKTAFFSNVSHEFRTPLTLMLGPLEEVLQEEGQLAPSHRERIAIAHRSSLRLLKLVNSLLDFSRIEAGRMRASYARTDLAGVTRDLASNFRSAVEGAGLAFVVNCLPLPEPVYVDFEMWEKIVLNLLSNAFKYTFDGGITITLEAAGHDVVLSVSDTGTGIPEAELPQIFNRFHRVEGARGRSYEGTGIGLALVQELVRMHGGAVTVESEVGKGSTFFVRLPSGSNHLPPDRVTTVARESLTSVRAEAYVGEALGSLPAIDHLASATLSEIPDRPLSEDGAAVVSPPERKPRVLLAEDNADMRNYIVRLAGSRMQVTAVRNGQEALASALKDPPDLVISDVMMPELDGFGLLRQLRSDPRTSAIPVILLSARAGEESRIEGAIAGADDYLVKPFSAGELLARVTSHLKLARVRREAVATMRRLQEISTRLIGAGGFESLLQEIMDAAAAIVGADLGMLHLADGDALRIVAQAGHQQPFLDFFADAGARESAGREALKRGERVVVEDVESSPLFAGSPSLAVLRAARVRSSLATPLFSRHGKLLGILTTQWKTPHVPDEADLWRLDLLVRQAADLIESSANAEALRASEERLTMAIEAAGMGTWDVDLRTGMGRSSRRHFEILGYQPSPDRAATLEMWRSRVHPDDLEDFQRALRKAKAPGERYVSRHRIIRADSGEVRWVEEFGRCMYSPQGEAQTLVGISFDTTERARAAESSLLLGAIVDSSDDAIISKDLDGVVTSWNKAAERLFGYTAEEAIGQTVAALLIPADRQDEEPGILRRLRRGERVDHFETVRRRKDGTLLDISLTISPVKDDQGRVIGASKVARDITDRKEAEAQIRKSEQRFRAMVTASSDAVYQMNGDWTQMRFLVGRKFVADTVEPSDTWLEKYILPEDQVEMTQAIKEAVRSKSVFALEHRIIRVDGTPGWSFSRAVPILNVAGELTEWFGTASDVTDLKNAEKALQESEERLRQLAEIGPQIVWLSGPRGDFEFVNRRWIEFSGLDLEATRDPAQMAGRMHPEDRLFEHWNQAIAAGTPFELEARLRGRDGEFRWFMMRSVPVRDEQGQIQRWFGTSTDIHENKLLQLELRRANQDLEQFAYSASHDLQEPLRSVKIFSELMSTQYRQRLDGQALEFLNYIGEGASRMEALVRDLLAYTQTARADAPPEPVDANSAFEAAVANLAGAIDESGATISCDPLPRVRVHATQLQQLFQNLIGNAIKYRRPGVPPVVQTTTRQEGGDWIFSVKDNGIGIEQEFKEQIFGLFKRLHTRDEYAGTGIGLALCQRIVERHHGRIWVESEPGQGSTFFFALPI
jgi:PAS domain S-box-containing protein